MPVHKFTTTAESKNVRTQSETVIRIENNSDCVVTINEEDAVCN